MPTPHAAIAPQRNQRSTGPRGRLLNFEIVKPARAAVQTHPNFSRPILLSTFDISRSLDIISSQALAKRPAAGSQLWLTGWAVPLGRLARLPGLRSSKRW